MKSVQNVFQYKTDRSSKVRFQASCYQKNVLGILGLHNWRILACLGFKNLQTDTHVLPAIESKLYPRKQKSVGTFNLQGCSDYNRVNYGSTSNEISIRSEK